MNEVEFGPFRFNFHTRQLKKRGQNIPLDPRQLALLVFFIDNPDRIISRDELQSVIWKDIFVSDNAISKSVANLRKLLGDDPKNARFIQTVPKQGYRFISTLQNTQSIEKDSKLTRRNKLSLFLLTSFAALTSIASLYFWSTQSIKHDLYGASFALTRQSGLKITPLSMINDQGIIYLNKSSNTELWAKPKQESPYEIATPFEDIYELIEFTSNGDLVIRALHKGTCSWYKVEIKQKKMTIKETMELGCNGIVVHDSDYSKDIDELFVLAHPEKSIHSNRLYRMAFNAKSFIEITSQRLKGLELERLDLNPLEQKLLLVTHNSKGESELISFDLQQSEFSTLKLLTFWTNNAIWAQDGSGIVYTEAPPATKLLLDHGMDKTSVIVSQSNYLCCDITRASDGINYLFTSRDSDFDLQWLLEPYFKLDNSTSYEMLPIFSHHSETIFFVSKRSGRSQLYAQEMGKAARAISNFNSHLMIQNLALSTDDHHFLFSSGNQIYLFDQLGKEKTIDSSEQISHIDWLSENIFAISFQTKTGYQVKLYDKDFNLVQSLDSNWVRAFSDFSMPDITFLLDKTGKIYKTSISQPFKPDLVQNIEINPTNNFKMDRELIYEMDNLSGTMRIKNLNGIIVNEFSYLENLGFDVKDGKIIVGVKTHSSSELMSTLPQ